MTGEIEKLILYLDAAPDRPAEATAQALDALSADNPDADAAPLVNAVLGGDLRAMNWAAWARREQRWRRCCGRC